jgi:hypothetical protein
MMKELVFAQALLLTGELEEKEQELLRVLCGAAASALELRLKEGLRLQDCEGDLVAAASLYAVAALLDARETSGVEEFKAGDLSVKTGGTGQERAGKALYRQAELLAKPYLADSFAFVGV